MAKGRLATARRILAVAVMICLAFAPGLTPPVAAQAAAEEKGSASIRGALFQADESTPLAGAKVTAINVRTGKQYVSAETGPGGDYVVEGLIGGTYDLVVEFGGNLFVVDNLVDLSPGESASRSFSVQPQRPANRKIAKLPPPAGSATPIGETVATPHFWSSTSGKVLIGVLAAGAAVALYNGLKNDDEASPSSP